jgi:hypothetical protein
LLCDIYQDINYYSTIAEGQHKKRYEELLEKMHSVKLHEAESMVQNIFDYYAAFKAEERVRIIQFIYSTSL